VNLTRTIGLQGSFEILGPFGDRDGINGAYGGDARFAVRHGHDGQRTLSITVGLAGGFQKETTITRRRSVDPKHQQGAVETVTAQAARERAAQTRRGSHAYAAAGRFSNRSTRAIGGSRTPRLASGAMNRRNPNSRVSRSRCQTTGSVMREIHTQARLIFWLQVDF
jgi:hypothetical protein